ncbi:MAG: AGE family epimerase/isomerase, partial [Lachnospiraceae bacterium]|nr:AGE family epimerase/isomerase [Lachnospiraceae bacterium]
MFIDEVREHLTKKIIPFWNNLRDDVNGGFYGYVDSDLNVDKQAVKGCILNSRILWFYSNAYMVLKDKALLDNAKHAYEFMTKYCIDRVNGGVYWAMNYDGTVFDSIKHTYNQAFAIYALSSYYDASGDKKALDQAFELFNLIENICTDDIGYLEAFTVDFKPESNEKISENGVMAEKSMNTLLHVLEAYTELYRVSGDDKVAARLRWIFNEVAEKLYNPKLHRLEVFFDREMNSIIDLHSYGHDIETSWL